MQGEETVVGAGGIVEPAGVALRLPAQKALGVAAGLGLAGRGDGLGILLRLGEVDRHVELAVLGGALPLEILHHAVGADIVARAAEIVVIRRRLLRALGIARAEAADDLRGAGGQEAHEPRVKEIFLGDAVVQQALLHAVGDELGEDRLEFPGGGLVRPLEAVSPQGVQQRVLRPDAVTFLDKVSRDSVIDKLFYAQIDHLSYLPNSV